MTTTPSRQEFTSHDAWHIATAVAYPAARLTSAVLVESRLVDGQVVASWDHANRCGWALLAEATPKFKEAEEVVKKIKDKFHLDLTVEEYTAWASYEDTSRYPQKNADAIFKVDGIVRKIAPDYVYSNADAEAHYRGGFPKPYLRMGLCEFLGIKNYSKW